ncbi:hypothetical protein KAJ61_05270 [Candidatus Parcubacteria bacterium]|nr:hypothetical protein [Candidatus Parcubacteria bacterium]
MLSLKDFLLLIFAGNNKYFRQWSLIKINLRVREGVIMSVTINLDVCKENECPKFNVSPTDDARCFCLYADPFQFELREEYEKQKVPKNCRFKDKH